MKAPRWHPNMNDRAKPIEVGREFRFPPRVPKPGAPALSRSFMKSGNAKWPLSEVPRFGIHIV